MLYEAPEQLFAQNQYNKSVDMWSCGIVMYELLTLGDHPIWKKQDFSLEIDARANKPIIRGGSKSTREIYQSMLLNLNKVDVRTHLQKLRTSENCIILLENLLSVTQSVRYKVDEALKHPWISRHLDSPIPESPLLKKTRLIQCYQKLASAFCTCFSLAVLTDRKEHPFHSKEIHIMEIKSDTKSSLIDHQIQTNLREEDPDESNLIVEEVDDQAINDIRQCFSSNIMEAGYKNSVYSDYATQNPYFQKDIAEFQHYQSLVVLSPIKETGTTKHRSHNLEGSSSRSKHLAVRPFISSVVISAGKKSEDKDLQMGTINESDSFASALKKTLKDSKHKSPEPETNTESVITIQKRLKKDKKSQDKVRVIIQSSQAKNRKNSHSKSDGKGSKSNSHSPEQRDLKKNTMNKKYICKGLKSPKIKHIDLQSPESSKEIQENTRNAIKNMIVAKQKSSNNDHHQEVLGRNLTQALNKIKQVSNRCKSDGDRDSKSEYQNKQPKELPKEIQQKLIGFSTKGFAKKISPTASIYSSQEIEIQKCIPKIQKKISQLKLDTMKLNQEQIFDEPTSKRNQSQDRIYSPYDNQNTSAARKEQRINEYSSFLQSVNARFFLQEEFKKMQEAAIQQKQGLQIKGSMAKIQPQQQIVTKKQRNKK